MKRKKEDGQAMVEFALVLPILLLLFCGILDFGWLFGNELMAANASRDAARYASIHSADATVVADTKARITVRTSTINHTSTSTVVFTSSDVTVTVKGDIPVLTPFLSTFVDDPFQINSATTMKLEK